MLTDKTKIYVIGTFFNTEMIALHSAWTSPEVADDICSKLNKLTFGDANIMRGHTFKVLKPLLIDTYPTT